MNNAIRKEAPPPPTNQRVAVASATTTTTSTATAEMPTGDAEESRAGAPFVWWRASVRTSARSAARDDRSPLITGAAAAAADTEAPLADS